jgi:hypothetical protein
MSGLDDGDLDVRAATGDLGVDELGGRNCRTEGDRARRRAQACAQTEAMRTTLGREAPGVGLGRVHEAMSRSKAWWPRRTANLGCCTGEGERRRVETRGGGVEEVHRAGHDRVGRMDGESWRAAQFSEFSLQGHADVCLRKRATAREKRGRRRRWGMEG